uniref:Uncharacterized protein n=1 Tax=Ananas comosus var. bracteatus TaxID=296719 RepID=A0A6V7NQK6_ANACO|nr:unnamed protein product [Ananas comosus var. bracteatus]
MPGSMEEAYYARTRSSTGVLSFKVGDGCIVDFWSHQWCGDSSLQETFPQVYAVSASKNLKIAQCRGTMVGIGRGNQGTSICLGMAYALAFQTSLSEYPLFDWSRDQTVFRV